MHVAILTWWISTERDIALLSGANMHDWVQKAWHTSEIYDFPKERDSFLKEYKTYDLVIPVFHGIYGEDGQIPAFLETLGCPYAYSSFMVHALCIDKYRTNLLIEKIGVKIPRSLFIARGYFVEELPAPLVCYPLIVKPNRWGSSLATKKVENRAEFLEAQSSILDDDIIVQECIEWREFTVWVYKWQDSYHVLPIAEICTEGNVLFDYREKYETDGYNEVFSDVPKDIREPLEYMSILIAETLDIRWVVRIDYRYDGKNFYFLEVNTIPGFTSWSFIPKMWKKAGKIEKEFVEMLII